MRAIVCVLILLATTITAAQPAAAGPSCPTVIDEREFTSETDLRRLNATIAGFGARTTASPAHRRMVDWVERQVRRNPGVTTRSESYRIQRWLPVTSSLSVSGRRIPVAGAIPYSRPTLGSTGELVHLTEPITAANARGKVVIRDFPAVDRGYLAETALNADLIAAGLAGAAGLIVAFDFPREQVRDYYDPHTGTHYRVPGLFVGVDEAVRLKQMVGARATLGVLAVRDRATTRSVVARLPGQSRERIVFDANTDGVGWVQENANAALLALARYFAGLPLSCRPRTFEFVFATGHLHRPAEGTEFHARALDAEYDSGTVAFAFAMEHLGAREYVPVPREGEGPESGGGESTGQESGVPASSSTATNSPASGSPTSSVSATSGPGSGGRELRLSGQSETFGWFAGSPALSAAAVAAIGRHGLDRVFVIPGIDPPDPVRVPPQCSFGGLGTHFHSHLIPTMAMISGPWSLWAPSFGEEAVDFARMRRQTLAAGDATLALSGVPREEIAGPYLGYREARAAGASTCPHDLPPEQAP
jgi:hypothetical protein